MLIDCDGGGGGGCGGKGKAGAAITSTKPDAMGVGRGRGSRRRGTKHGVDLLLARDGPDEHDAAVQRVVGPGNGLG